MNIAHIAYLASALMNESSPAFHKSQFFPVTYERSCRHCYRPAILIEVWYENVEGFNTWQNRACCAHHIAGK